MTTVYALLGIFDQATRAEVIYRLLSWREWRPLELALLVVGGAVLGYLLLAWLIDRVADALEARRLRRFHAVQLRRDIRRMVSRLGRSARTPDPDPARDLDGAELGIGAAVSSDAARLHAEGGIDTAARARRSSGGAPRLVRFGVHDRTLDESGYPTTSLVSPAPPARVEPWLTGRDS